MSIRFFLYRRLSKFITCELKVQDQSILKLESKYEVASFKDVFCHPFYWQVFQFISKPPALVVDCGAHCGHFSILADLCVCSKFGSSDTHYVLIEPNPHLLPTLRKNLADAGIQNRSVIRHGLVGMKTGTGTLWVGKKSYLTSGINHLAGGKPHTVQYIDLAEVSDVQAIDILKVDIEGGEFEFVRCNKDVLLRVNLLLMELHVAPAELHQELLRSLKEVNLHLIAEPIHAHGQQLMIFQRPQSSDLSEPVVDV